MNATSEVPPTTISMVSLTSKLLPDLCERGLHGSSFPGAIASRRGGARASGETRNTTSGVAPSSGTTTRGALCPKARSSSLSAVGRKADPDWAARLRTIAPMPLQGSTPAPSGPWWRRRKALWSLLVLLLVLVSAGTWWAIAAATADTRPIIVRGHIQTNGDEVWVTVNQRPKNEIEPPSSATCDRRATSSCAEKCLPAAARELVLYVEPTDYVPVSCGYKSYLPPLRLAGDRWVEDSTGEPLVATIDLPVRPQDVVAC